MFVLSKFKVKKPIKIISISDFSCNIFFYPRLYGNPTRDIYLWLISYPDVVSALIIFTILLCKISLIFYIHINLHIIITIRYSGA